MYLGIQFYKSLIWVPILAKGPYLVPIWLKFGSLFQCLQVPIRFCYYFLLTLLAALIQDELKSTRIYHILDTFYELSPLATEGPL